MRTLDLRSGLSRPLTQQQQLELPSRVLLVAAKLPLDLRADALRLFLLRRQTAATGHDLLPRRSDRDLELKAQPRGLSASGAGFEEETPEPTVVWSERLGPLGRWLSRRQFRGPASPESFCGLGSGTQPRAWEREKSELGGVSGAVSRRCAPPDTVAGHPGK